MGESQIWESERASARSLSQIWGTTTGIPNEADCGFIKIDMKNVRMDIIQRTGKISLTRTWQFLAEPWSIHASS